MEPNLANHIIHATLLFSRDRSDAHDNVQGQFEKSLKALDIEYIDLYVRPGLCGIVKRLSLTLENPTHLLRSNPPLSTLDHSTIPPVNALASSAKGRQMGA
jgi:hypothetical protein